MMRRKAFTLVELIITIAIIAVLAVTAFLVITKWISRSRDSGRLQDISIIQQGLETEIVNTKTYPMPDNYTGVYDTGNALARYQGEFTDNVKGNITTLNKTPKDPQGRNYGYSLSNDKKQYQIRALLENTSYNFNYTDTVSAATQVSKINGNYNGFLVTASGTIYTLWNIPTLFVWSGTGISSGTNYINENNKPSDNTTAIKYADVSGLYDANTSNDTSTLDGIVTTFSGSNGVNTQDLAKLTMKTAAGGLTLSAGGAGGCGINHILSGGNCVPDIKIGQVCTGLPSNASWNTVGTINQIWSGGIWSPTTVGIYNLTASTDECRFKCIQNYARNGSACIYACPVNDYSHGCAGEGGYCTLPAGCCMTVVYCAGGHCTSRYICGGAYCTNDVFGDPYWGQTKSCYY